jgi:hypothetical protein
VYLLFQENNQGIDEIAEDHSKYKSTQKSFGYNDSVKEQYDE